MFCQQIFNSFYDYYRDSQKKFKERRTKMRIKRCIWKKRVKLEQLSWFVGIVEPNAKERTALVCQKCVANGRYANISISQWFLVFVSIFALFCHRNFGFCTIYNVGNCVNCSSFLASKLICPCRLLCLRLSIYAFSPSLSPPPLSSTIDKDMYLQCETNKVHHSNEREICHCN